MSIENRSCTKVSVRVARRGLKLRWNATHQTAANLLDGGHQPQSQEFRRPADNGVVLHPVCVGDEHFQETTPLPDDCEIYSRSDSDDGVPLQVVSDKLWWNYPVNTFSSGGVFHTFNSSKFPSMIMSSYPAPMPQYLRFWPSKTETKAMSTSTNQIKNQKGALTSTPEDGGFRERYGVTRDGLTNRSSVISSDVPMFDPYFSSVRNSRVYSNISDRKHVIQPADFQIFIHENTTIFP